MPVNPILENLRRQIRRLEDGRSHFAQVVPIAETIDAWLPQGGLSTGCIHEVKGLSLASAMVFTAILSARIAGERGNIVCIAPDRLSPYPIGLQSYGIRPDQILHISTRKPQHLIWAVMEALRCSQVGSVMALVEHLDLTESRRLQLAAEASGVTGFLLGKDFSKAIAAPVTRWKVSPRRGEPGRRFDEPVWSLDLLYCRGGRPGQWTLEWRGHQLNAVPPRAEQPQETGQRALAG